MTGTLLSPSLRTQLLRVGPHAGAHRVAFRASVSVAVPLLVLWSVGHLEWAWLTRTPRRHRPVAAGAAVSSSSRRP